MEGGNVGERSHMRFLLIPDSTKTEIAEKLQIQPVAAPVPIMCLQAQLRKSGNFQKEL